MTRTFHKIKIKVKKLCFNSLIKLSVMLNLPGMTAWLFAILSVTRDQRHKYTVLVLGRSIFYDDIAAMKEFSGQLNYRSVHLDYWQIIFGHFTDPVACANLSEATYHIDESSRESKKKYYEYLSKMFPYLQKYMPFEVVLTGNIGYIVQQELSRVCEDNHIPFIVLHKEAVVLPEDYQKFVNTYKDRKFLGAKMLFYNKMCRDGFLGLNLPGLLPEKAVLVGIPRLDQTFKKQAIGQGFQKQVVLFSFLPRYSLRFMDLPEAQLQKIDDRSLQFFKAVMEFAQRHSDFKVIIKTKMAGQYFKYPTNIYQEHFNGAIANLQIVNTGDPSRLIADSTVVLGFNSTTLIEAMITGKPIICPDYGDIITDREWDFFQRYPQLAYHVRSLPDLENVIMREAPNFVYQEAAKNSFLDEYISTNSGGASKRAESEIIQTIVNYSKFS